MSVEPLVPTNLHNPSDNYTSYIRECFPPNYARCTRYSNAAHTQGAIE